MASDRVRVDRESTRLDGDVDDDGPCPLAGRALRFVLVAELMKRPDMTVAEMTAVVHRYGHQLTGRASKVVSDALRWEVRRGRVVRLGRGLYRFCRAPASTARRIRLFAARCHRHTTTAAAGADRVEPPWADLRWLWVT
jgi:hypothetical protein